MTKQTPDTTPAPSDQVADDPEASTRVEPADLPDDDLAAAVDDDLARQGARRLVPEVNGCQATHAITLLLECCERFGIEPFANQFPKELLSWRFYPGSDMPGRISPDAVVVVTAGGLKIKHYDDGTLDGDTEERLRAVFHAFEIDPVTKRMIPLPLPDDLHLPRTVLTCEVASSEHVYDGGYLQAGGPDAAEEKERRRAERQARLLGNR